MNFAERIKQERLKRNLDQKDFGEKINVAQSTVATWESGTKQPRARSIMRISAPLGWSEDETLAIIYEKEGLREAKELRKQVWQASLRMGRLGYHNRKLALLIGAHYKTILNWLSGQTLPNGDLGQKYINRLEEFNEWTDDEIKENLIKAENNEFMFKGVKPKRRVKRSPEEKEWLRKKRVELMRRMDEKTDVPGKEFGRWYLLPDDDEDLLELRELMGG